MFDTSIKRRRKVGVYLLVDSIKGSNSIQFLQTVDWSISNLTDFFYFS